MMTIVTAAANILTWYDRHRRDLPWRAQPGERADPYHVWLSEVMLQQTTVATVGPYFRAFLERWPDINALAGATLDEVLHAWQGLGYYSRARNLHKCAQVVAADFGGRFPESVAELTTLAGIGPYTAAAIAAIAFDQAATPIDGNIERVMARLHAVQTPLPKAKAEIRPLAEAMTPAERPGDYAQAVMDLGATVCLPREPRCMLCPWAGICQARAQNLTQELPRKKPKKKRPTRFGIAFWLIRPNGQILLRRREESGLLGGMMEIPSTPWRDERWSEVEAFAHAPNLSASWRLLEGTVKHTFTHFHLELQIATARGRSAPAIDGKWHRIEDLGSLALPTLMKKVVRHALTAAF